MNATAAMPAPPSPTSWAMGQRQRPPLPPHHPPQPPQDNSTSPPRPPLLPRLIPAAANLPLPPRGLPPSARLPSSPPGAGGNPPPPPFLLPAFDVTRPPRMPFFVREIYKNGFLKRLPHNEKKSSALSKLMRTDRFWVVFSVHDDAHPFLELWNEPTEVATKPPQ